MVLSGTITEIGSKGTRSFFLRMDIKGVDYAMTGRMVDVTWPIEVDDVVNVTTRRIREETGRPFSYLVWISTMEKAS